MNLDVAFINSEKEQLYRTWQELIELSPRFMGTIGEERAVEYLSNKLRQFGVEPVLQPFMYEGWRIEGPIELTMVAPERVALDVSALLGSGSTGHEKISGRVVLIGETVIWNMYSWPRFGIVNEADEIIGYVTGRPSGKAISQTLAEGNSKLPHFIIGAKDTEQWIAYLESGLEIKIEGQILSEQTGPQTGYNVRALFPSKTNHEKVIVCAHYDTMFNTPGAYDNTSGVAVLLHLAQELQRYTMNKTVEIIFMSAEEWNLAGSKAYVNALTEEEKDQISFVINVEGLGRGERLEAWVGPEQLEREMFSFANEHRTSLYIKTPPPPGSDHTPFYDLNIPACMFTIDDQEIIHSAEDIPQSLIFNNMIQFNEVLIKLLRYKQAIQS